MNTFFMTKRMLFVVLFSISFLLAFGNNTEVNFIKTDSFEEVQEEAKIQNRPIFVDFHAAWCAPCKKVDKEVFNNSEVATFMNENFVNYKVNIEKGNGPLVALIYEIEVLPSVVIVQPDGEIILKKSAYMGSDSFLNWAKEGNHKFSLAKEQPKVQDLCKNNLRSKFSRNIPSKYPDAIQYRYFHMAMIEKKELLKFVKRESLLYFFTGTEDLGFAGF